ncbi:MFS transporter [Streptomyces sp. NPDC094437]|uniref:MFS transporter n=1 Tax=Streptomyces sp. NPDC094437 TaxID=3366060 RepID=UPI00381A90C4
MSRGSGALLWTLSGNMLLDSVEVSIMLVALPSIGAALRVSMVTAQWLMSGFGAGFAGFLVLGPRLVARWDRRRVYLGALAVFALVSVVGGLTGDIRLLIAIRVVKGGCAALTAPTGLAIITTTFPDGPRLRRAVSVYALFGAVGFTAGLLLSGALVEAGWRWTLVFPAPVALALLLIARRVLPTGSAAPPRTTTTRALLRAGALRRSMLGAASLNGTYIGVLLLAAFDLSGRGWSPWLSAVALLPASLPLVLSMPFVGGLVQRFGTARLIVAGAVAVVTGCVLRALLAGSGPYGTAWLPALLLVEAGFVLSFAPLNMQVTAGLGAAERPWAVALYQTAVQAGGVLMLPLTALLASRYPHRWPVSLLVLAAGAVGLITALSGLRRPRPAPLER